MRAHRGEKAMTPCTCSHAESCHDSTGCNVTGCRCQAYEEYQPPEGGSTFEDGPVMECG